MLLFKKQRNAQYSDELVKNMFGFVLESRGEIIPNEVFMREERALNGIIGFSGRRLSDELDSLAAYYAYRVFIENGFSEHTLDIAINKLFDEFVEHGVIEVRDRDKLRDTLMRRVGQYMRLKNHSRVAAAFMAHVVHGHNALADDIGKFCAPVLKTLYRNMQKIVEKDLRN